MLVILTLRADFMGRVADEPALAAAVKQHLEIVSPMAPPDLRRAIELPAEVAGGMFQPGLVDELIGQVAGEPGALPLLEYSLESLWAAKRSDGTLTWESYRAIGGVEGALAQGADRVLGEYYVEPKRRGTIRDVLLRLVQPGDGSADSRRCVPFRDLVPAGSTVEVVQALITPLVDARLLTTGREADTGQETVEVTHEALIRSWPTLRDWTAAARADLRLQRQLEDAAREWEEGQRLSDLLWQGVRLAHAEAWVAQARPMLLAREQQFLAASRAAETARIQAERRRARQVIAGLIVALILIAGFAGGAIWFRQIAERSGQVSQARFLIAEGQRRYAEQPLLGLRLMAEGLASVPPDETSVRHDLVSAVMGYVRQGRVGVLAQDATNILAGPEGAAQMLVIARRGQPGVLVWGDRMQETVLSNPIAINRFGLPAVVFGPNEELVAVSYADGKGAALLHADGTLVPLTSPLATNIEGLPAVVFSPNEKLVAVSYAARKGAALLHADGAVVQLTSPLATNIEGLPAVVFSPNEKLVAVSYAEGKGAALLHADGALVPLPNPLAIASYAKPAVVFSPQGELVAVNYAEGKGAALLQADGTLVPLPSPLATYGLGQPAVVFSPNGQLVAVKYAYPEGTALLHADGTIVPLPNRIATDRGGRPGIVFSLQGELGALNYAEGKGAAFFHADGTIAPLPNALATDIYGLPAVVFSPQGELGALNYAEGKGAAFFHADGTVMPLPSPLAIGSMERPAIAFSSDNRLVDLEYVTGYHELRPLNDLTQVIDLRSNVASVTFMANSPLVVVSYKDGHVYVVDPRLPPGVHDASDTPPTSDLITFICDGPLKSGFWTPQDDADLAGVLQGAAPQACVARRP